MDQKLSTTHNHERSEAGAASAMLDTGVVFPAIRDALRKLDPRHMIGNTVMFCVEVVATLTTLLFFRDLLAP